MDFLTCTLAGTPPATPYGETAGLRWRWLGEGVLEFTPRAGYRRALVLSAGIHGNETAPIELLDRIVAALLAGELPLECRLLVILGNVAAIRAGQRYLDWDLNRLFGRATAPEGVVEAARARALAQIVTQFFITNSESGSVERWHLDLHTTQRASHLPCFALTPFQPRPVSPALLAALEAAGLDALVRHSEPGSTFSHFTCEQFMAASCTLELGAARRFGDNDLSQFQVVDSVLRALVSASPLPIRQGAPLRHFRVARSLIKRNEGLTMPLAADTPNFTAFARGALLGEQTGECWRVEHDQEWILFANPNVAPGLRAGLMLVEETAGA